jgi:phenylalanyl-tRNA synthetase beta chain
MLISIDWIKEFVNVPDLSPKEIGSKFTLATAEVEDVITTGGVFDKIVVAEIVSFEKHPEADKLNLVTFKINATETRKVVCGASNVKVGIKIPYACVGLTLPNGMTLEPKKIRGILSEGMLCSQEELGLPVTIDGIFELPTDTVVGSTMLDFLKLKKDTVLDVDNKSLTHRPDLWGHFGIAREFSAIFETPLKNKFDESWQKNLMSKFTTQNSPMKVKLVGESSCLSYYGLSVDGVTVTESPEWMKTRLTTCGLRSINSIVDISNYVMLELGFPLHIFDRDQIAGDTVLIKSLEAETKFKTLDEIDRSLIPGDTVICDNNGPLVLAGIMGGKSSGVSESTSKVFIEVANWKAAMTRRTSTRLGLRTDSSQRYEKSLDSHQALRTMLRTLELILELNPNAKVVGKLEYDGLDLSKNEKLIINSSADKISKVLGKEITFEKIKSILNHLDFNVSGDAAQFKITVPTNRSTKDVEFEADIIEEIGRIIGFDNIAPVSPLDGIAPVKLSQMQKLQRRVRDFLVLQSKSFEVMTYPLIGDALLKKVNFKNDSTLKLYNSISIDNSIMRPSLIPSFLEALELNAKYSDRFRMFEIGRSYLADNANFSKESMQVCVGFFNKEESPFIDMLNTANSLLNSLGLSFDMLEPNPKFPSTVLPADWSGVHPVEVRNFRVMGKISASIFSVHPVILKSLKVKGHYTFFILDLSAVAELSLKDKTKYKSLNKFPSSSFDWTVCLNKDQYVGDVLKAAQKTKLKELESIEILDIYHTEEKKYVTLRAVLTDENATLSPEFLKSSEVTLIKSTSDAGFELKK